jgi:cbb3-type cytochrome oxidase maturation protein
MSVLLILILASLTLAAAFLAGFIWAVRSGQFEDTCTPSMRILTEEETPEPNRSGVGQTSGLPVCGASGSVNLMGSKLRARGPANRQTGGLPHTPA